MANIKSAQKRARQTKRKTARNSSVMSALRTALKAARNSKVSKNSQAVKVIQEAVSKIMKAASKGVLHKKTASRYVSRLTRGSSAKKSTAAKKSGEKASAK